MQPAHCFVIGECSRTLLFCSKVINMFRNIFWLILLTLPTLSWAQSENVNFFVDIWRFHSTFTDTPRAQVYLALDGTSVRYEKGNDNLFRPSTTGKLELFRLQGNDTNRVYLANLSFKFPENQGLRDTTQESKKVTLLNIEELGFIPGTYLLIAEVSDQLNLKSNRTQVLKEFHIETQPRNEFGCSDIKWVSQNTRKGRTINRSDLLPMVTNDFFANEDTLRFYQEFYFLNTMLEDRFFIRSVLYQGEQRIPTTQTSERNKIARNFNAHWETLYIGKLPSNSYFLQVEILNKTGKPVYSYRKKFYVYNSRVESDFKAVVAGGYGTEIFNQYTEDTLDYFIQTLMFKATDQEMNFARVLETYEQKKNFIYSFFDKRKKRDQKIIAMWKGHLAVLDYVNENFDSSLRPGWQTDRGRVFIQYGIPNDVDRYPAESSVVPYEIWSYNRIGAQSNLQFVFYDPDLATNEYPLLHSNKYGELNNPRWQSMLVGKGRVPTDVDYENTQNRILNKIPGNGG